jgi:tellurite methyltransferase
MSRQERAAWDERFRTGDHASEAPDPFLAQLDEYLDALPPDRRPTPLAVRRAASADGSERTAYASALEAGAMGALQAPSAIDLACGAGRNAVYLAEQGWDVTACDISLEGLKLARVLAENRGVSLRLFCQDLETIQLPAERFDLSVCFFYLQRKLFPQIKAALRRGGLVCYKTYTTDQLRFPGRPRHSTHMLRPQELLEAFEDFRVFLYQETVQGRGIAQLIAQKPV